MARQGKRGQRLGVVALALIAAAWAVDSGAQGRSSNGSSGSVGSTPAGGGAAANRGGAGGVSNPSPGGEPAAIGGPGHSDGPLGTETSRAGYLGGRTPTPPPSPPPGSVTPASTLSAYAAAQFGTCALRGRAEPRARMSGSNADRIEVVAGYLSQGGQMHRTATARYLVADLQEELEKPDPNLTLAGTYFGIASALPVDAALVADVSASLCTRVSEHAAQVIAGIAETQRRKLSENR